MPLSCEDAYSPFLEVKGLPVQIRPSRLVVEFFRIYFPPLRANRRASPGEMAPPEARGARMSPRPTRACAKTAEPGKPARQGIKDHRATPDLHGDPTTCEPADTIPRPPVD